MMVPLAPWLQAPLAQALALPRAHAVLLCSAPGLGLLDLAQALGQAWLCEDQASTDPGGPRGPACGRCAACHLFAQRSHPDAHWLLPAALRVALGWQEPEAEGKAKPSREIRVDEVRALIGFAQATQARSQGKAAVVFPAEAMNAVSANALLKTLEEPGGRLRFALASETPNRLLPTVRSRCQSVFVPEPTPELALPWLQAQHPKLVEADGLALLRAAGQRPGRVVTWLERGWSAAALAQFPRAVAQADLSGVSNWPMADVLDLLQRMAVDLLRLTAGAAPAYFEAGQLPRARWPAPLHAWADSLRRAQQVAEHPLQAALWLESLGLDAQAALRAACKSSPPVHSAA